MRRISVWMVLLLILLILVADRVGIDLDPGKIREASKAASLGKIEIEGRITEVSYVSDDMFRILLDSPEYGKILYSVYGKPRSDMWNLPGRTAVVEGEVSLPNEASNPRMFDYRRYLRSEGVYLMGKCDGENISVGVINSNPFKGIIINKVSVLKNNYCRKMDEVWEGSAGLFAGMLFGDSSIMDEELYDSFRKNGTAHILSVSGLHVGVLYGAVRVLMRKRKNSLAAACIYAMALAGCALLASFSISVMRAISMIGLHIISEKLHKRYDLISAACITAVAFLVFRPYMLFSSGFILSFSAVIALAVVGGGMNRIIKNKGTFVKILIPIVSIQLGMLPINIYMFNYFSFASLISNIPVIFLSSILIPLGIIGFMLSISGGPFVVLFEIIARLCGFLGDMMIFFNDFSSMGGILGFYVTSPPLALCGIYYILLFFMFSEYAYLNPLKKRSFVVLIAILLVLLGLCEAEGKIKSEVVFVDVGQGDCIHVRTPSGKNYLVDGGGTLFSDYDVGEKVVLPYLLKNGVGSLDGIFISHMDADHYKGLNYVIENMGVDRIYLYEGYREYEEQVRLRLGAEKEEICYIRKGNVIHLDKDISVRVIFPNEIKDADLESDEEKEDNPYEEGGLNELSSVMILDYLGTKILLTGDIGEGEEKSIKVNFECDIVKVPHHGSRYSSSEKFVSGTGALAAVIQVGKNNFGHPDESIIERYRKKGIIVFRNDKDGAILVNIRPGSFELRSCKGGKNYEF